MSSNITRPPLEIVYLDTNVVSFYFDKRPEARLYHKLTNEWWEKRNSDFYISSSIVTQNELEDGDYPHKSEAIAFLNKVALFPINEQVMEIAYYYIEHYLAPKEEIKAFRGDALHTAICAFYKVDYLLTWNQRHLANVNKLRQLRIMNGRLGLSTPEIITPTQLLY